MHVPGLAIKLFQSEFANGTRESRRLTTYKVSVDPQKFSSYSKEPKGDFLQRETHKNQSQLPVLATSQSNPLHSVVDMSPQILKQAHMNKVPVQHCTDLGLANTHVCKLTPFLTFPKTKYYTSALVETNYAPIKDFFLIHLREKSLTAGNSESRLVSSPPSQWGNLLRP